jgi:hypothetical protein
MTLAEEALKVATFFNDLLILTYWRKAIAIVWGSCGVSLILGILSAGTSGVIHSVHGFPWLRDFSVIVTAVVVLH